MPHNFYLTIAGRYFTPELIPVIFFHGFSGSSGEWLELMQQLPEDFFPVAFDLPGHGKNINSTAENFCAPDDLIDQIKKLYEFFGFQQAVLAGYSMGGRAALTFNASNKDMVAGLFLESTTAGIRDENERAERINNDVRLAEFILNNSIEEFADYWMNLPLFASQKKLPDAVLQKLKNTKLKCNRQGLAKSLTAFGTGSMLSLWDELKGIKSPVHLLTGELDEKFTSLNKEMQLLIPTAEHTIIKNCGHNIHLENPKMFLRVLLLFLKKFKM